MRFWEVNYTVFHALTLFQDNRARRGWVILTWRIWPSNSLFILEWKTSVFILPQKSYMCILYMNLCLQGSFARKILGKLCTEDGETRPSCLESHHLFLSRHSFLPTLDSKGEKNAHTYMEFVKNSSSLAADVIYVLYLNYVLSHHAKI